MYFYIMMAFGRVVRTENVHVGWRYVLRAGYPLDVADSWPRGELGFRVEKPVFRRPPV